jgi:SAM-dependent methyltransferase
MDALIARKIKQYYDDKLKEHGATPKGVDWKNEESQILRFSLLGNVFSETSNFEVNDLGCGYGAFAEYLLASHSPVKTYHGYDLSSEMIKEARGRVIDSRFQFIEGDSPEPRQFCVSSGIFNVKLDADLGRWELAVEAMLKTMRQASSLGFAFNMLNVPTAEIYRLDHLYYARPEFYVDYCRKNFGRRVELLTAEGLYEFTILVRDLH